MYAKWMTARQISDSIEDMYGFDVFEGYIRAEGLIPRRLRRACWFPMSKTRYLCRLKNGRTGRLMMFIRSFTSMQFTISVRDNAVIVKKAAYVILGLTCDGRKEALPLAISAKFRLNALNELKKHGVQDVMIISAVWFTWSAAPWNTSHQKTWNLLPPT